MFEKLLYKMSPRVNEDNFKIKNRYLHNYHRSINVGIKIENLNFSKIEKLIVENQENLKDIFKKHRENYNRLKEKTIASVWHSEDHLLVYKIYESSSWTADSYSDNVYSLEELKKKNIEPYEQNTEIVREFLKIRDRLHEIYNRASYLEKIFFDLVKIYLKKKLNLNEQETYINKVIHLNINNRTYSYRLEYKNRGYVDITNLIKGYEENETFSL